MAPSEITNDLRKQAAADYAQFMTTDSYKSYTKAYNVFVKKNPGYEEKIADKLNAEQKQGLLQDDQILQQPFKVYFG